MDFQDLESGKVKLEFGNQEQILAIDRKIAWDIEQAELSTFRVTYTVSGEVSVEVRAHDKDEAQELAEDEIEFGKADLDYEYYYTEEIE